jgi:hypothetical protein
MSTQFASGKRALSICDRCGFTYPLRKLKTEVVKTKPTQMLVCPACWTPDQPQLSLGMFPVFDPQALRNPRPDTNRGTDIYWGWNPVGYSNPLGLIGTVNVLEAITQLGTVGVSYNFDSFELREDGGFELREDGGLELRN